MRNSTSRLLFPTIAAAVVLAGAFACKTPTHDTAAVENYSFAAADARVTHIALDVDVDFDTQRVRGSATIDFERAAGATALWLDTWDMTIDAVRDGAGGAALEWRLGEHLPLLGRPLAIDLAPGTTQVVVDYATGDDARALQWLTPEQTTTGKPFLYTQSQAIMARSWVPCQDNPLVRFTYDAQVRVPSELLALMSASNETARRADGAYAFEMPQPIPSYLLALAVGDLEFRPIGDCCGVYAEPGMVEAAAWEFGETDKMMEVAERLYGPYRWDRFDLLVLPPSFPFGGMENPRLTFLTPVLVAGDRSLVSTVAHELAHSWSGNLVTNATWEDFWLNEGFTTYFERRIMEAIDGPATVEMHAILGKRELLEEIADQPPAEVRDTALYIPLEGRDPDEELGTAPYEKGYLFLRMLEEAVGRETFDRFLRGYFDSHAFQSTTTDGFVALLRRDLLGGDETRAQELYIDDWVWEGGLPPNAPEPQSTAFEEIEEIAGAFVAGADAFMLDTSKWTTQQWEHFLASLPTPLEHERLADLERTFELSKANGVIQRSWFNVAIESEFTDVYPALEAFLLRVGRAWLLRPLYSRLVVTPSGREFAEDVYSRARPGYHSATQVAIDGILAAE